MKYFSLFASFIIVLFVTTQTKAMSLEQQRDIIEDYMYITGQRSTLPSHILAEQDSTGGELIIKCGMSAVTDFVLNKDKFDKALMKSLGVQLAVRPIISNEETYDSPGGIFKIHFARTGPDSVYQSSVDNNSNGIPDYVDATALIFDSVYNHMMVDLGYPPPPSDGFYNGGGDDRFDVYLTDLPAGFYGYTQPDSLSIDGPGSLRATTFMVLDRDYQNLQPYINRPLDAVRVTAAHEFFHVVQFGIDFTESALYEFPAGDSTYTITARYWMEMSAVWMEEEIYDEINDYYLYLPYFFTDTLPFSAYPYQSIQQFKSFSDIHPYASAIFPMYLSQVYGRDIIREIWLRCGEQGYGDNFLPVANHVIDSMSGGTENWATAFREFALWNYFTGPRAELAPAGVGYSERANYPGFRDVSTVMATYSDYPFLQLSNKNALSPRHNSAAYVTLDDPDLISSEYDTTYWRCNRKVCLDSTEVGQNDNYDFSHRDRITCETTYWVCNSESQTDCIDSTNVGDTAQNYDFTHVDSVFDFWAALGDGECFGQNTLPQFWGVSILFQPRDNPDEYVVDRLLLPDDFTTHLGILNVSQYRSITFIFSPATYDKSFYRPFPFFVPMDLGYFAEAKVQDSNFINLPGAVLTPYPNPCVVSQLSNPQLHFRFQVPTDTTGIPLYGENYSGEDPGIVVDIFNIAGERVRTITGFSEFSSIARAGLYELEWDMKNESGKDVASGVYICYARLYSAVKRGQLLAEDHAKVAIIR